MWWLLAKFHRDRKKGVITKGDFSLEESLESVKSLESLESLENGRILLCFPESGGSLEESAYNQTRWATFRLQKVKKQREIWKMRQEKVKMRKKAKTLKREKPPHQVWGFFWAIFYYKTGDKLKFWPFLAHWLRLWPRISKFSRISRKWTFLKRPLFQKTPSSEPDFRVLYIWWRMLAAHTAGSKISFPWTQYTCNFFGSTTPFESLCVCGKQKFAKKPKLLGGQKVRYVPRNPGKPSWWDIPGFCPGYPWGARKVWERMCVQFLAPNLVARIARYNRDARCDSNRTSPNR